jgi:hypothetical protein
VRDETELVPNLHDDVVTAADAHQLETDVPDIRETAVADETEHADPAEQHRVPDVDETAAAVTRAQEALAEIEARRQADATREAEEQWQTVRREELTRWTADDRAAEPATVDERDDDPVLECKPSRGCAAASPRCGQPAARSGSRRPRCGSAALGVPPGPTSCAAAWPSSAGTAPQRWPRTHPGSAAAAGSAAYGAPAGRRSATAGPPQRPATTPRWWRPRVRRTRRDRGRTTPAVRRRCRHPPRPTSRPSRAPS